MEEELNLRAVVHRRIEGVILKMGASEIEMEVISKGGGPEIEAGIINNRKYTDLLQ
jgi:hypothetical protein